MAERDGAEYPREDLAALHGLRICAGPLELRFPTAADRAAVAAAAAREPYDPSVPFLAEPGDTPRRRGLRALRFLDAEQDGWSTDHWSLTLTVLRRGEPAGTQNLRARGFAAGRQVETGSWTFPGLRGQGTATLARAALLHLLFTGLGAREAVVRIVPDNAASLAVAAKLGYAPAPGPSAGPAGAPFERLTLTPARWRARRTEGACGGAGRAGGTDRAGGAVRIEGLDACLPLFGLSPAAPR